MSAEGDDKRWALNGMTLPLRQREGEEEGLEKTEEYLLLFYENANNNNNNNNNM